MPVSSEPNYETLNPRTVPDGIVPPSGDAHVYENLTFGSTELPNSVPHPAPINTATFRINRSASGSNIVHPGPHLHQRPGSSGTNSRERDKHRRSYGGAIGGESTESLIRSSTTNLAKRSGSSKRNSFAEKRRSGSTSNLHTLKRGSSSQYLNQEPHEPSIGRRHSTSVKPVDSGSSSMKKQKLARTSSSNNLPASSGNSSGVAQRRSSIGPSSSSRPGGPVANNHNLISRQTSLNVKGGHKPSSSERRPHTSSCDERQQAFEWPSVAGGSSDPLPSDMEVMVSDAENLDR